ASALLLVHGAAYADGPAPPDVGAVKALPAELPEVPSVAATRSSVSLAPSWPPAHRFETRSKGLLVTGVVLSITGAVLVTSGAVIYAIGDDPCSDGKVGAPRTAELNLFCKSDRTPFTAGMTLMAVGGTAFALGVPMAVFGGSSSVVATVTASPRGAGLKLTF
ncbi:MAG TPA: hypothetical protein VGM56_12500, partial [Byssovorax sp.]